MRILNLLTTLVLLALHQREVVAAEERPAKDEAVCTDPHECEAINATLMAGPTEVGELKMLQFQDGRLVDPYAFRVKLPPNVTDELRQFVIDMGFPKIFYNVMGAGEFDPEEDLYTRIRGKKWYIRRPEKKWNSNSHWLNPTDEKAHDQFLRVLGDGGFDIVLDAIGKHFGLEGLTLYSVGFFVLDRCENGWMHDDFKAKRTFNVLIPLNLAENGPSELYVESSEDSDIKVTVEYEYDMAVGVGDHTRHAAGDCDYRHSGEVRLMTTLYLSDIREDNVADIIKYYTDPFPPADEEYLLKWRGIHWNKDETSKLPRDWRAHTLTEPTLLPGPTKEGELSPLQFSDGTLVDPYTFRVKFPETLTQALRSFCEEMGFYDIFRKLLTPEGSYEPGESKHVLVKGKNWYIQRPERKWHSNSHWLNAMDEEAYDQFLRVLGDGGFDVVLDAIGRHFDLEGLVCYSVGFFAVSHCEEGWIHDDFKKVNGKAFNLLIPVELPKEHISELKVESTDYEKETVKVGYEQNIAIGVGDYSRHGTGDCDYRDTGEMRVMVTIYLADIDEDNVKHIIEHYTDPWPPADQDYLLSRSGIHWSKDGATHLPHGDVIPEEMRSLKAGPTKVGELVPLEFHQNGVSVDPFAFLIGLPTTLTKTLVDYCDEIGMTELFQTLMGSGGLRPGKKMYLKLKGDMWYVKRPWKTLLTTVHFMTAAEEVAHERYLRALGEGGFDAVLEGIGRHFGLDGLTCYSVGFGVVNENKDGSMYYMNNFRRVSGKAFNIIFPIILPKQRTTATDCAQHYVQMRNDPNVVAKVDHDPQIGLGVGDFTRHVIGNMEYHDSSDMLVFASVLIADITEENIDQLIRNYFEPFPPKEKDYFLKHRRMHWKKNGSSRLPREADGPLIRSSHTNIPDDYHDDADESNTMGESEGVALTPGPTKPGQLLPLQFTDGRVVDPYSFRVGVPNKVSKLLREYCDTAGLSELFVELMGEEGLDPGDDDEVEIKGNKWYVQRPGRNFHTTAHWLNPNDEKAHEQYLRVLDEGGFDVVLEAIGRHFDLDGLTVYSVGFSVLDQCEDPFMYYDFKNVDGKAFSLTLPLLLDDESNPKHYIKSSNDHDEVVEVDYEYDVAIGVGDGSIHCTGDVAMGDSEEVLIMATIYMADIDEGNVSNLIKESTDPFPPKDKGYFMKRRGLHWKKDGKRITL